ncbi:CPBP family intramembrane glutamic endopeptidase [Lactococcus insecticola]|nr:CPBP family intramembrane glutamic endopeptidase [Lactococcus insecticola]
MNYFDIIESEKAEQVDLPENEPKKQTWLSRLSYLLLLLYWQVSQGAVALPMDRHQHFHLWKILAFLLIFIVCVALSYDWARKHELIPKISLRQFPLGKIATGFVLMLVTSMISGVIMSLTKTDTTENQAAVDAIGKALPPLVFFIMTVSAGFFEELVFRVSMFELLFNKWPKVAMFFAWGLFTAAHMPTDIPSFLTYGLMSLVLTSLYTKYRNFYLNMSVHFLWNAVITLVLLLGK